jgi:hypothetical protein
MSPSLLSLQLDFSAGNNPVEAQSLSCQKSSLSTGGTDDVSVGGKDLDAGNGGEIAVIGDDLKHAVGFHGFEFVSIKKISVALGVSAPTSTTSV